MFRYPGCDLANRDMCCAEISAFTVTNRVLLQKIIIHSFIIYGDNFVMPASEKIVDATTSGEGE